MKSRMPIDFGRVRGCSPDLEEEQDSGVKLRMPIDFDRVRGKPFQRVVPTEAIPRAPFSRRMKAAAVCIGKGVILSMKDLQLFASLNVARFIVWKITRTKD